MKRTLAIISEVAFFLLLLYFSEVAWLLAAGFFEIIVGWNVCFTKAGGIVIALLIPSSAVWLYFFWPRKQFRTTPGHSLVMAAEQGGKPRSAFFWYCRVIGILLFAYIFVWMVSATVFSSLVKKQQQVLETLGVPRDWRQAFPEYCGTGNAARFLDTGTDTSRGPRLRPVSKWFGTAIMAPDSIRTLEPGINSLLAKNKDALASIDSGLACDKLVWQDYRNASIDTFYQIRIPNYMRLQDLTKLWMLAAGTAAYRKDWKTSEEYCLRAVRLIDLLCQDPILIGKMIAIANQGVICDGLTVIAKNGNGDPHSYALVRQVCGKLPSMAGQVREGMIAELASMTALLGKLGKLEIKPGDRKIALVVMGREGKSLSAAMAMIKPVYRIWLSWDLYCTLRAAEYSLRVSAPENDAVTFDRLQTEYEHFTKKRLRLPALMSSIAVPNFAAMCQREREARAKPAAVALFAATLDYRRSRGTYPERLDQLVPKYFPQLPVSPVNGKGYDYTKNADTLRVSTTDSKGNAIPKTTFVTVK